MPEGSLSVSKALQNVSLHFKNEEYIWPKVFGEVPVKNESGHYWVYTKDFRLDETYRADKTESNQVSWKASTASYVIERHALKDSVSQRDRDNSDLPGGSIDNDTTEFLTDKLNLRMEYEGQKLLFTTTTFSSNATLTTATSWNYNTTTSAPIQNGLSATGYVLAVSGKRVNKVVTNWDVLAALKENNNVYNRLAYTKDKMLTEQILASMFDVGEFLVGTAYYETNQEGLDATSSAIWPADALFMYQESKPGIKKLTTAHILRNNYYGMPYKVSKWYEKRIDADWIEVEYKATPKAVCTLTAYLFKTAALI
jgi:hypothetical protein